jgi:hypothetical protein
MARFPRAYDNDVPKEGDSSVAEYVDFDNMGIGARKSGTPPNASEGPKNLTHVGNDASGGSRGRQRRK